MFSTAVRQKCWISTVSREHVLAGVKGKFCQVCHGKKAPLARMKEGDWIIYYSPKLSMGGREQCQKFTAIGKIADDTIYQFKMTEDFIPFRRNVNYLNNVKEQSIRPLLNELSFTKGKKNWGSSFRLGIFEIPQSDFELIYHKMVNKEKATGKRKLGENYEPDCVLIEEKNTHEGSPPANFYKRVCFEESEEINEQADIIKIAIREDLMHTEITELTHTEYAKADAKSVWEMWSDCSTWPKWDLGVESCELKEGSKFELNGEAYLQPKGSPSPITIRFTECTYHESFTDEGNFELGSLQFSHKVVPHEDGVEITHSLKYVPADNKAKNIFEMHMLPRIRKELAESVKTLARLAEENSKI